MKDERDIIQLAWERNFYLGETNGHGTYSLSLTTQTGQAFIDGFDRELIERLRDLCQEILDFDEMISRRKDKYKSE